MMKNKEQDEPFGLLERGTVNVALWIHEDDCPQLVGGKCNCKPALKIMPANEWLESITAY